MKTSLLKYLAISLLLFLTNVSMAQDQSEHNPMSSSSDIIELIQNFEKLRLDPYRGASGKWVVGYGHLLGAKHQGPITQEKAEQYLRKDLKYSEMTVSRLVKVPLAQREFDALVSLTFNIGSGAFANSTVLKRLNQGDKQGAADAILMWNKAGGKRNSHLIHRRKVERNFFLGKSPQSEA